MANKAICGRTCSVLVGANAYSAHKFSLSMDGQEKDVTSFGASAFGEWLYCMINGELTVDCYEMPSTLNIGDIVAATLTFGFTPVATVTIAGMVKSIKHDVDAKGEAMFTIGIKLTGAPSVPA